MSTPRDIFREQVFKRDRYTCVICHNPGVDAYHIIERRLFEDGGYYLDNGATLCATCHIQAEQTVLSCDTIRKAANITNIVLPQHLFKDSNYDKWGNEILNNGTRIKGELFDDPSVQKILKEGNQLHLFANHMKYPRTYHFPWSPGLSDNNERCIPSLDHFLNKQVIVTVKMDGENTTLYKDGLHARSLDYSPHPSRNRLKAFWSTIAHDIPDNYRVCVENLYAKHSILYNNLPDWWLGISIWANSVCLDWDNTLEWFSLLNITPVPVIYKGLFDIDIIKNLYKPTFNGDPCEGYVMRLADSFHYKDFKHSVAKYVRPNHVQTSEHWKNTAIIVNGKTAI